MQSSSELESMSKRTRVWPRNNGWMNVVKRNLDRMGI